MRAIYLILALLVAPALGGASSLFSVNGRPLLVNSTLLQISNVAVVNWADAGAYVKPIALLVAEPTGVSNNYYLDLTSGSGTTCSQVSPCATFGALSGKAGINGGPANIYVKGTGQWDDQALVGSSGNEIVVRPWDDSTTATFQQRVNWNNNKIFLIVDGGPNMQLRFVNSGPNQFDPVIFLSNSNANGQHDITFYRTRWQVTNGGEQLASYGSWTNLSFINSEFFATGATVTGFQHHVYISGCNAGATMVGLKFLNNIFYNTPGEAIELRIAGNGSSLDQVTISGNAFHDLGQGTCSGSFKCRGAITFSRDGSGCSVSGGTFGSTGIVFNNLIWNTGEGAMRTWDNPSTYQFYNNTVYAWGLGNPANNAYSSAAFQNFSFTGTVNGDFRNNAIYATGTDNNGNTLVPFSGTGGATSQNNACRVGPCGTSAQTITGADFQSLSAASAAFLLPNDSGLLINHGQTLGSVPIDYAGFSRPQSPNTSYTIGAVER